MNPTNRPLTCIECSAVINPGDPALCVATPEMVGCLCPRCLAGSLTREAALARLWRRVRERCGEIGAVGKLGAGSRRNTGERRLAALSVAAVH